MVTDTVTFIELDSVDSTNSWLLAQLRSQNVACPVAVMAHQQTRGRGRMGRTWHAQRGHSLCLSVALQFRSLPPAWVTLLTGLKVCQFLETRGISGLGLKWPNDLMVGSDKLGGILCESASVSGQAVLVIGVGVNLLPVETGNAATSLSNLGAWSTQSDVISLAKDLAHCLCREVPAGLTGQFDAISNQCRSLDVFMGQPVQIIEGNQITLCGTARGVNEQGAYLIETSQGLQAVSSGDVSLRQAPHV
ncbi:MAG: biotin--[acetyl-CoA-carboxylase] ligase [Limnobacter sp.]|nr:biotin--[acetyl-CoA-carboxylase] ligase [Limnobacter sp.]